MQAQQTDVRTDVPRDPYAGLNAPLHVREFTLTNGREDFKYTNYRMNPATARKMIALLNAYLNAYHPSSNNGR